MQLKIKLLTKDSICPKRKNKLDAGLDIYANESISLLPHSSKPIKTGVSAQCDPSCYIRVAPRSGLAYHNSVDVLAGVVDSTYTGEIMVILINHSDKTYTVTKGDRIAQLIVTKIDFPEVIVVNELQETERNESGFGSSGK